MSESIEYKGYTIEIENDECSESPRDWDNLGTMVCFHGRYRLGDKHDFRGPEDFLEYLKTEKCLVLPLYLYDHSDISISTGSFVGRAQHAEWDSGQVGWIYVTYGKIREECGRKYITRRLLGYVTKYLVQEIGTYDQYLRGDVYGYSIKDIGDSCWGFYGYDHDKSGLLGYAKGAIDYYITSITKKRCVRLKELIANRVPLNNREQILGDII